jgi:hypothetical protein
MIELSGAVAQWIERRFPKPCVGGSSPLRPIAPSQTALQAKKNQQTPINKYLF